MSRSLARFAAILWASALTVACSNNSNSPAAGQGGDAATADAASTNDTGSGLDAAIGPIKELNGDGAGGPNAQPITCGSMTCSPRSGGMLPLSPCCLSDNGCGASLGAAIPGGTGDGGSPCLNTAAGSPDPSCPSQTIMGMPLTGCCSVIGVCGVDLSLVGLGCNSLSALGPFVMVDAGAPQPCSGGDSGSTSHDAQAEAGDAHTD
jgi:hypothetical protein